MSTISTRLARLGTILPVVGVVAAFSCAVPNDTPVARDAGAGDATAGHASDATTGVGEVETAEARSIVETLRARYSFGADAPVAPPLHGRATWTPLPDADVDHFERSGDVLSAVGGLREPAIALAEHPVSANGFVRLTDPASKMAVNVTLRDAADTPAEIGHGIVVYKGAWGGGHVLRRPTAAGVEDFIEMDAAPQVSRVEYDVDLIDEAVGLRLVGDSLEFVDAKGVPRLRMAPPRIIGSDGVATSGRVTVVGCAVDANPGAPWRHPVTPSGSPSCTVQVDWDSSTVLYPALFDPAWSATGSLAAPRENHTATLLTNGDVLVIGGSTVPCELYNTSAGTWATTGANVFPRLDHTATLLQSGQVLVAAGTASTTNGASATAERYNPTTGTWTQTAGSLPYSYYNGAAALMNDGRVLLSGGTYDVTINHVDSREYARLNESAIYTPSTDTFAAGPLMAADRMLHTLTTLGTGNVVAAGGNTAGDSSTGAVEQYNPSTNAWTAYSLGSSNARQAHSAFLLSNGSIALLGGEYRSTRGIALVANSDIFSPSADTWTTLAQSPSTGAGTAVVDLQGVMWVIGGFTNSEELETPTTATQEFTTSGTRTVGPSLLTARMNNTTTVLAAPLGKLLSVGGWNGTAEVSSAELMDPCANIGSIDDGNQCTTDYCDGYGVHHVNNKGASCTLASPNACMSAPQCNDSAQCTQWTSLAAGTYCGNANTDLCNGPPACNGAGACVNGPPPVTTNSTDLCVVGTCTHPSGVVTWAQVSVDDGNPCTVDTCVAGHGPLHTNAAPGSFCGANLCAPSTCVPSGSSMACTAGVVPVTDDGNVCTSGDACNSTTGVVNTRFSSCGVPNVFFSPPGTQLPGTAPTSLAGEASYLYSGSSPSQTIPNPSSPPFDPARVAILRGRTVVAATSGTMEQATILAGVTVSVVGHPEYGTTASRVDGWYDFVVNGGATVTLAYQPPSGTTTYLPAQRTVVTRWNDWTVVDDVALTPRDTASTQISLTGAIGTYQWASASQVTDVDGTRTARLLFPSNTTASTASGPLGSAGTVTVRATEYTVGPNGSHAMPGSLPPSSAYTYSLELGIDEAQGQTVNFANSLNDNVLLYVDNDTFLKMPPGPAGQPSQPVPMGSYDPTRAAWVASQNGQIVFVTNTNGTIAVSLDGTTTNDALPLDFKPPLESAEVAALGSLVSFGTKSFMRIGVTHFSSWDANWGFSPPAGAGDGDEPPIPPAGGFCLTCAFAPLFGSIIKPDSQILGEDIPVVGTSYSLHYSSDATRGRGVTLTIPWVGNTPMPSTVTNVYLNVTVAGRAFNYTLLPTQQTNQSFPWQWDRSDAYGQFVQGPTVAHIAIGYAYRGVDSYTYTTEFGHFGNGTSITANRSTGEIVLWQYRDVDVGGFDAEPLGFGGWMLSSQHLYDFQTQTLFKGDGGRTEFLGGQNGISTFGSASSYASNGGGGNGVAVGPDGSVFAADADHIAIWNRSGETQGQVGVGCCGDASGDGQPPYASKVNPSGIAVGPDGAIYFGDNYDQCRIRKVVPDANGSYSTGTISTVVGLPTTQTATCGSSPDDTLATSASIQGTGPLAIGSDGTIYFADTVAGTVRMVTPAGTLSTIAGSTNASNPEPSLTPRIATGVYLAHAPYALAVDRNGTLYIADGWSEVLALTSDGTLRIVAGSSNGGFSGDGAAATAAALASPAGVAVALDGTIFISDVGNNVIRKVDASGIITTIAGQYGHILSAQCQIGANGDGGPAAASTFDVHQAGVALSPDGSLMVANLGGNCGYAVRRIAATLPFTVNIGGTNYNAIVDFGGKEAYVFDALGRHWETLDTTFGNVQRTLNYDPTSGLLASIVDRDGITTIARTPGVVTITSPYQQVTTLNIDADGYATTIANPKTETTTLTYESDTHENGLLATLTDPRFQNVQPVTEHKFGYSASGLLTSDEDPTLAMRTLATSMLPGASAQAAPGWSVYFIDGSGTPTAYSIQPNALGGELRTMVKGAGATTSISRSLAQQWATISPDGTTTSMQWGGDPRFGLSSPFPSNSTTTRPVSSATATWSTSIVATPSPTTPMALASKRTTRSVAGTGVAAGAWLDDYESSSMTDVITTPVTTTAPSGRQIQGIVNANGQITSVSVLGANLVPMSFAYDSNHLDRMTSVTIGDGNLQHGATRTVAYNYAYAPDTGFISSIVDPGGTTAFTSRDLAGRVLSKLLPDQSSQITEQYDLDGNPKVITPPGKPPHDFTQYTGVDLLAAYEPPAYQDGGTLLPPTTYSYFGDMQLNTEVRVDGAVARTYDPFGRVQALVDGQYGVAYSYVEPTSRVFHVIATGGANTVETDYVYDGLLPTRLTWSQGVPGAPYVDVTYDGLGRVAQRDVNGASSTTVGYGPDGLPSQIGSLMITRDPTLTVSGGGQGASGLIASTRLGSAVSDTWGYNWFGEFTDYTATFGSTTYTLNLVRDSLGRVITKTENGAATSYTYDTLGRVSDVCTGTDTTCQTGAVLRSYVYYPNGNRKLTPTGSGSVSVDNQDRLESYGATTYTFTDGGDLATKTDGTGTTTYSYDRRRNLRTVTLPNNVTINYTVDGMNRRVGRSVSLNGTNVATQYWIYQNGLQPIAELNGAGTVVSVFVYGTRDNVPDYMIQGSKTYRLITDQVGSVRYVVDASNGSVAQQTTYDEFGNPTVIADLASPSAPGYVAFQPFGFAGGLWDEATGLVRFGARDYDATTGRWTSKDERLLSAGLNVYAYADNDPMNKIDPMGTDPTGNAIGCLGGALIGAEYGLSCIVFAGGGEVICSPVGAILGCIWGTFAGAAVGAEACLLRERAEERRNCKRQLSECLDSPISGVPGNVWGVSVCDACYQRCIADGGWPSFTQDGKSCDY